MFKKSILFATAVSLFLVILTAVAFYSIGLRLFNVDPSARAAAKPSSAEPSPYLTREERDEYKIYLMTIKNEESFMFFDEWKLSKVFKKTLAQLGKENER